MSESHCFSVMIVIVAGFEPRLEQGASSSSQTDRKISDELVYKIGDKLRKLSAGKATPEDIDHQFAAGRTIRRTVVNGSHHIRDGL